MGAGSVLMWSGPFPCYLRLASRLVGAGGQQQRRGVHSRQRHRDGSIQQCGELEEGRVALQLGRAQGSHWTEAGPELDIGEQRAGSEQQTRRSLCCEEG